MLRFTRYGASVAVVLAGAVLGFGFAVLRTEAGRSLLVANAVSFANDALQGTITVDRVGGSFVDGLELEGLLVRDVEGTIVANLPWVSLRYRIRDLIGGRVVLGQVRLRDPYFNLVDVGGGLNLRNLISGEDGGNDTERLAPLVAFRDVLITGGRVDISTRADRSNPATGPEVSGVPVKVRRIEAIETAVGYLRLSSPVPGEESIHADIDRLAAVVSDPSAVIQNLSGNVDLHGRTLNLVLSEFSLGGSITEVSGSTSWPTGALEFDLRFVSADLRTEDLPDDLVPFPDSLRVLGDFALESRGPDTVVVSSPNLQLVADVGGNLSGKFAFVSGPNGHWAMEHSAVTFADFALRHFGLILDSIPLEGDLSGVLAADGPWSALAVTVDAGIADAQSGGERSFLRGHGVVAVDGGDGLVFDDFEMERADISLRTVRLLIPAIDVRGRVEAAGTVSGPWRAADFVGRLIHRDGPLPPSTVVGSISYDATLVPMTLATDLRLDSIDFEGLRRTYAATPLEGRFAGRLSTSGPIDSLAVSARLAGPAGTIRGEAVVRFDTLIGAREFTADFNEILVYQIPDSLPATSLTGSAAGRFLVDSATVDAAIEARLRSSLLGGFEVDSVHASLAIDSGLVVVDSLAVFLPHAGVGRAAGTFGWRSPHSGELHVNLAVDSLPAGRRFFGWLLGALDPSQSDTFSTGALGADMTVTGRVDSARVTGNVTFDRFGWSDLHFGGLDLEIDLTTAGGTPAQVAVVLDTLARGNLSFSDVGLWVSGVRETFGWTARARPGIDVSFVAGGTAVRDSSGWLGRLDSMAVLVPSDVWFTERATDFAVSESGLRIDSLVVVGSTTAVRLLSVGTAGFGGPSTLSGRFEGLQVRDILGLMQLDSALGSGTLSGSYELAGNAVSPEIRLAVVASDARWLRFPSPDVRVTAEYSHRTVEGSLEMVRLGLQLLHLDLTLPVDLAFVPVDRRLVEGDLRITARADGMDLSIVEAMTSSVRDTRGRLDMDAAVSGTWADPSLSGTITLRDGGARFPSINATHSDLFARALLAGDTIYIDSLSVKSGEGTALIGGYIHLVEATAPVLDLRVTTRDFHTLSIPNFLDLTGSADLRVTGPVFDAHVTGTGGVSSGVLFFADLLEKQIINLEDTLFAGVVDTSLASTIRRQGLGAAFSTRFFDSLTVDSIRIDTGQDMWLRSQEANILLTGNVLARKTGSQYRLDGVLNTPRGIYTLPVIGSREFNVTRGEIRYQGSPDLDAEIDVEARYPVRTITGDIVTVFVRLGGTIYAPTVTLTSDITPAIPETEIVSYLISGGPTIGGGPAAARMAANVAAALSGQLQSLVGLGIPIDYFQFRPVEGSSEAFSLTGAELIIGKQLFNSDLFVTANPLFCRTGVEIGAVNLEYRFNPEWRFSLNRDLVRSACQAATGAGNAPTYQLGLDLFWEKSY